MADGSVEEQDLLIRDREVRKRIDIEERAELLHVLLEVGVNNRRREKPEREDVRQNVANVAEMDRERGEQQAERAREDELHGDGDRKPEEIPRVRRVPVENQEDDQDDESEEEVHHVRQDVDDRQHFGRKQHFLDQVAAGNQRTGGVRQGRREPRPRQNAAEHEKRVRSGFFLLVRNDRREHERVDQQEQQRVDERPEKPEDRTAIAGLQLARDEARDEPAIAQQVGEVGKQSGTYFSGSRHLQADERLQERDARRLGVHVDLVSGRGQPLFRALLRRLRAHQIDLVGLLGDLREDRDTLRLHLGEPVGDHEIVLLLAL